LLGYQILCKPPKSVPSPAFATAWSFFIGQFCSFIINRLLLCCKLYVLIIIEQFLCQCNRDIVRVFWYFINMGIFFKPLYLLLISMEIHLGAARALQSFVISFRIYKIRFSTKVSFCVA